MKCLAELEESRWVVGLQAECIAETLQGFLAPALQEERGPEVEMGIVQIRTDVHDRPAAVFDSFGVAQLCIDLDQVDPGFDIPPVALADFFEERPGFQYLIVSEEL